MNSIKLQRRLTKAYLSRTQPNLILRIRCFVPSFSCDTSYCSKEFSMLLHFLPRCGLLVLGILLSAIIAAAQPPPLGPPLNRTEKETLTVSSLTGVVRDKVQASIDLTNAILKADKKDYRLSIDSVTALAGWRSQTVAINKPNRWCVLVPVHVKIKVAIPLALDRRIFIPIDVKIFCDGWHKATGGTIIARGEPGPASFEGGSTFELFGLGDHIDGQVRAAYRANLPLPSVLSLGIKCSTLGYSNKGTASVLDDKVVWDSWKGRPDIASINPTIEVTFEKLKRLRARRFSPNTILYKEVEEITFRGYANYANVGKSFLSMREGDEVALRLRKLEVNPQVFEMLVVIGNIEQPLGDSSRDSSFITAARSLNYSPGRHQLQIPKWFSEIDQHTHHPIFTSVPAYELTYFVRFNDPIRR